MDNAEFRTLLRSMQASLEALRAGPLTPEQSAHIARLNNALRKLSAPFDRLKVLVVDDREDARSHLIKQLCDLGCTSDGVSAGFRATGRLVRALADDPYHAVIIHGGLRDTPAAELAKSITQDPRWQVKVSLTEPVAQAPPPQTVQVLAASPTDSALRGWLAAGNAEDARPVVVVAEDSRVNQKLAEAMLTRLGYRPLVVDNGVKAVAHHRTPGVVAMLMDGQMPELDGYEATKAIRTREAEEGVGAHLPIIGVSADTQGRSRALAAGMDDYIHKPLNFEDLKQILSQHIGSQKAPHTQVHKETFGLDPKALQQLRLVSGDDVLLVDVCQQFLLDLPKRLQAIQAAAHRGAWDELAKAAHALKSAARAVGAQGLGAVCTRAEHCSAKTPPDADWLATLAETAAQAEHAIRALLGQLTAP